MAGRAAVYGEFSGLLPIAWILLNIIFLQQLAEQNGSFNSLQDLQNSLSSITADRRLQLLLIAFCFGAFFEGPAGFGTSVEVTAGILIGLAFANSGVMGKMIDVQSIAVASTATKWFNHKSDILRILFFHSVVLACLVGGLVMLPAYVWPFALIKVH